MPEDKLTIKEIQIFNVLHTIRRIMRNGRVSVILHEHDFVDIEIEKFHLDGEKNEEIDRMKILLSAVFPSMLDKPL